MASFRVMGTLLQILFLMREKRLPAIQFLESWDGKTRLLHMCNCATVWLTCATLEEYFFELGTMWRGWARAWLETDYDCGHAFLCE